MSPTASLDRNRWRLPAAVITTLCFAGMVAWWSFPLHDPAMRSTAPMSADTTRRVATMATSVERALPPPRDDAWLAARLANVRSPLMRAPTNHRIQILVTRLEDGRVVGEHGFRVDAEYFYPASAIKTFVAVAALRELQQVQRNHPEVDAKTPLALCRIDDDKCRITVDPTNEDSGRITIAHEIRKMQLVSNNVAFNRLYDFVGHHRLNETFAALGLSSVRIRHRFLGGAEGGRVSPPMDLGSAHRSRRVSTFPLGPAPVSDTKLGRAHYDAGGKLEQRPFDFRFKNYASLSDLHRLMIGLVTPDARLAGGNTPPRLGLDAAHRHLLLDAMAENPTASQNPEYVGARYDIERFKAILPGVRRVVSDHELTIVSKSGRAFGFEVENAYVQRTSTKRAFFVTAVAYANPNEVINDNGYAYHLTRPFIESLGEELGRAWLAD